MLELIEATFQKYFANDKNKVEIVTAKHSTGNVLNDFGGSFISQDACSNQLIEDPKFILTPGTILDPAPKKKEGEGVYYVAKRPYFQRLPLEYIEKLSLRTAIRGDVSLTYNEANDISSREERRLNPGIGAELLSEVFTATIPTTFDKQIGGGQPEYFQSTFDLLQRPRSNKETFAGDPNAKYFLGNPIKNAYIRDHPLEQYDIKAFILMKELGDTLQVEWLHSIFIQNAEKQRTLTRQAWEADPDNQPLNDETGGNPIRPFEILRGNTYIGTNDYVVMMRSVVNKVAVIHTYMGKTRVYTARLVDEAGLNLMKRDFIQKRKNELISQNDAVIQTILEIVEMPPQPGGFVWFDGVNWQSNESIFRAKALLLTIVQKLRQIATDSKVFLDACNDTNVAKTKVAESQMKCPFTKTITRGGQAKWTVIKLENLLPETGALLFRSFLFKYSTFSTELDERKAGNLLELSQFGGGASFQQMYNANMAKLRGDAHATNRNRRRLRGARGGGAAPVDAALQALRASLRLPEMEVMMNEIEKYDIFIRYSKLSGLENQAILDTKLERYQEMIYAMIQKIEGIFRQSYPLTQNFAGRIDMLKTNYNLHILPQENQFQKKQAIYFLYSQCYSLYNEIQTFLSPNTVDLKMFDQTGLGSDLRALSDLDSELNYLIGEIVSNQECKTAFETAIGRDLKNEYDRMEDYEGLKLDKRRDLIKLIRENTRNSIANNMPRLADYEDNYPLLGQKNIKRSQVVPDLCDVTQSSYYNQIVQNGDLAIQKAGFLYCFVRDNFPEIFHYAFALKAALELLGDRSLDDLGYAFPSQYFQGKDVYFFNERNQFQPLIYDMPEVLEGIYQTTKKCIQYVHEFLKRYPNFRTKPLWCFMKHAEMLRTATGLGVEPIGDSIPMISYIKTLLIPDLKRKIKSYYYNSYGRGRRGKTFFYGTGDRSFDDFLYRPLNEVINNYFTSTGYTFSDILSLKMEAEYTYALYNALFEDILRFLVKDEKVEFQRKQIDRKVSDNFTFSSRGYEDTRYELEKMIGGADAGDNVNPTGAEIFEEEVFVLETPEGFTKEAMEAKVDSFNQKLEEALELSIHVYEEYYCQMVRLAYLDNNDFEVLGAMMEDKVKPAIQGILESEKQLGEVVSAPTEILGRERLGAEVPKRKATSAEAVLQRAKEQPVSKVFTENQLNMLGEWIRKWQTRKAIKKGKQALAEEAYGQPAPAQVTRAPAPDSPVTENSNIESESKSQNGGKRRTRKQKKTRKD